MLSRNSGQLPKVEVPNQVSTLQLSSVVRDFAYSRTIFFPSSLSIRLPQTNAAAFRFECERKASSSARLRLMTSASEASETLKSSIVIATWGCSAADVVADDDHVA